eukprot:TRINITY_DN9874_c0_g1_i2.p1 TRINITY_DN9874_c0_g1~~TRINITY_DN9874_c0_g1_i2.p1  ORF type:complete len:203 (+),score=26.14 TRINITY_DN9874_c0_g1_i2:328-936(+)
MFAEGLPVSKHIVVHNKYKDGSIVTALKKGDVNFILQTEPELDVDFVVAARKACVYFSESDLIENNIPEIEARCIAARKYGRPTIMLHRSEVTRVAFERLQLKLSVKFRAPILAVRSAEEISSLLKALAGESAYKLPKPKSSHERNLLNSFQCLPGVGEKKARTLLEHFPSWRNLAAASLEDLAEVVGSSIAGQVHEALHSN